MGNKYTTIKERFKQVADNKGISYKKLFEIIGMSDGGFKGANIKRPINSNAIENILTQFPDIDLHWLITGEETKTEENYDLVKEEAEQYNSAPKGVPYYDVEFESGFDFLDNDQTTLPSNYITHPFFSSSEFVVRNSGQSMAKVIKHGDAIGMIHLKHWREFIAFGEIYALVLKDNRRLIKVITKGDTPDTFTLLSKPTDNKKEEFPPQQIKKSFITNMFKVEAYSGKF